MTKPNPENCKNCSSKCAYDCAQLQYTLCIKQSSSDNLPSYLQTNITAQMLSIRGEGPTSSTAAGADISVANTTAVTETASPTDKPKVDEPYSHIQCFIDGLPDNLTDEQRARAADFIRSRSNIFSRSEYDIGRMRIIPHRIDTGDNAPHFKQLRRHPTTQLPMIDEHVEFERCNGP